MEIRLISTFGVFERDTVEFEDFEENIEFY